MIVITGADGVLGTALAAELTKVGRPFRALSRSDADLLDFGATRALFKDISPTMVLHCAGRVHGLLGNKTFPGEMFADNARINMNVIDAARDCGCRKFVGVSTVATYPGKAPMPISESEIWNGPPHDSESSYGHAKRAMLAQLMAYAAQYGMAYAYPIMTNLYGPGDRYDTKNGHVIPSLIAKFHRAAREGGSVVIWGTGRAERDFLFATDAARAVLAIADQFVGPINVASGRVVPIRSAVEILSKHTRVTDIQWDQSKPDGQILRSYDVSKLQALGFKAEVSLEEGLARTYDWLEQAYPNVRTQ